MRENEKRKKETKKAPCVPFLKVGHTKHFEVKHMINKIFVKPKTLTEKILFFQEADLSELPDKRIIPLFGANGAGKTTFLKELEETILKNKHQDPIAEAFWDKKKKYERKHDLVLEHDDVQTVMYRYRNGTDNFRVKDAGGFFSFDPYVMKMRYDAQSLSEGQSLVYSVEDLLKGMLKSTKKRESFIEEHQHGVVLLDEIDSGLSLDNIERCMKIIKRVLAQNRPIQFFMSFNNPYILKYFPYVLSMYDGKMHEMHTQEEMLEELKANEKMLKKTRLKANGQFRIYDD